MFRLISWTISMSYVGFLFAGKGSYFPIGVTFSGALMGAAGGSILGLMFTSRALRRQQKAAQVRQH